MFRRNMHEAIDSQIKEAMLRPLTAENLNFISDLYLRKGEKELAIECLYNAIAKLHVSQRDKMIAIYKKIIKLAPGDDKAYRGLIDIFAKMGLVAEEVNHLILLAKVYQSRGDYEKGNELYRRIHLIDPNNETAANYFGKGKPYISQAGEKDVWSDVSETVSMPSGHPETGDLTGMQGEWNISGIDDTLADEVSTPQEDWDAVSVSSVIRNKRVYLRLGITVLLILLAVAAGFLIYKKVRGGMTSMVQRQETTAVPRGTIEKQKEAGDIRITVVRMPGNGADDGRLAKAVGQKAMAENQFYTVTVQAEAGCIPEEFIRDPLQMIFFVGGNEVKSGTTVVKGLELMNRTVYKAIVPGCGENKAVFMKQFIAHPKGQQYKGIAVRMTEKGATETITWD